MERSSTKKPAEMLRHTVAASQLKKFCHFLSKRQFLSIKCAIMRLALIKGQEFARRNIEDSGNIKQGVKR